MQQITLRVSDDCMRFVRQTAGKRRTAEAEVWRELIERGIHHSDYVISELDQITKLTVQSLCMSQRVAGHFDEDLVCRARNDARRLIARIDEAREHTDEN